MKLQTIMASFVLTCLVSTAFAAVTPEARQERRQATVRYWKTVESALRRQGFAKESPEMIRTNRNLTRAEKRLSEVGSIFGIRAARPTRTYERRRRTTDVTRTRRAPADTRTRRAPALARTKTTRRVEAKRGGARTVARTRAIGEPTTTEKVKGTAQRAGSWIREKYEAAKETVKKAIA